VRRIFAALVMEKSYHSTGTFIPARTAFFDAPMGWKKFLPF